MKLILELIEQFHQALTFGSWPNINCGFNVRLQCADRTLDLTFGLLPLFTFVYNSDDFATLSLIFDYGRHRLTIVLKNLEAWNFYFPLVSDGQFLQVLV